MKTEALKTVTKKRHVLSFLSAFTVDDRRKCIKKCAFSYVNALAGTGEKQNEHASVVVFLFSLTQKRTLKYALVSSGPKERPSA